MWRFNWGNITAGNSWTGPVWRPSWFELTPDSSVRDQDLHEQMLAGKAPSAFRAYLSHQAGARDYVRILNNRFQAILAAAETGDPALFAEAVRTSRYCPDCGAGFEQSVRAIQAQIQTAGWFSGLPLPSMLVASKRSIFAVAAGAVVLAGAAAWGALAFLRGSR